MPLISVPTDFRCSITHEIFIDPVVTSDGFTYERSAIEHQFREGNDKSPLTNEPLPNRNLLPNKHLKSRIESFRETVLSESKFKSAIETGDLKKLESSAFLPFDEYSGINPFFLALESRELEVLRYLLKQSGENPAMVKDESGNTLLHRAGHSAAAVRYLVSEYKLPLEEKNRDGFTPLLKILKDPLDRRTYAAVEALLNLGADTKFSTDNFNVLCAGPTTLDLAQLLVKYGAGISSIVEQFFANGASILHTTWQQGIFAIKLFEYFLSLIPTEARRVAMVRRIRNDGQSLLHSAVRNPEILKVLLAPPYSLPATGTDKNGKTALHYWAMVRSDASAETLGLLLAAGSDIDAKTLAGKTALHFAKEDMTRFHLLMAAGANSNDVFESLTVGELRLLYQKNMVPIKPRRADATGIYVGKQIEALDWKQWFPAKIVAV